MFFLLHVKQNSVYDHMWTVSDYKDILGMTCEHIQWFILSQALSNWLKIQLLPEKNSGNRGNEGQMRFFDY